MKRRDLRVVDGEQRHAFTIGPLIESLQAAGVPTDEAMHIALEVDKHLRHRGAKSVPLEELVARMVRFASEQAGPEVGAALAQQTPPFVSIAVADEGGRPSPFSRRKLAASLEKLGLGFKEAHATVRQVELGLRADGRRQVPQRELFQRVASALEARYGRDVRARYEASLALAAELVVVEPGRLPGFPFSRGVLAQSLLAVGIEPELAHGLARRVEDQLWRLGRAEVAPERVRALVRRLVQEEAGEEFARRYDLMRAMRRSERPVIVVIGGAAGVGKSVVAAELGYRLGIPRVVATDSVRQALRSLISPELSPALHASSYAAWRAELLPDEIETAQPKRRRVLRGFQTQVLQVGAAIDAIIARHLTEATSVVIEGTHLVPGLSPRAATEDAILAEVVLAVADADDHRENFGRREMRAKGRPSSDYLDHFAEIRMIQEFVLQQAAREGVTVIDTGDLDRAVERSVDVVLEALAASAPETVTSA